MALNFPNIDPVALSIGPLEVRWYALAYLAGFLIGWRYALFLADKRKFKGLDSFFIDDFFPWAVFGVILGGRIGYTMFYNFSYYIENPAEILMVWHGGMSFHGGLIGMIISMASYSFIKKIPFLSLTDLIACVVPIGLFFGRIANFINAELYGRVTVLPWGIVFPNAGEQPRHPSQIYEALLEGCLLFLILSILSRQDGIRSKSGFLSGVFLTGYGVMRSIIELFRQPDEQIGFLFMNTTMGQILCIPMIFIGLFLCFYSLKKTSKVAS